MQRVTIALALVIVGIILLADLGWNPSNGELFRSYPYGDKAGHFLLMGVMALLLNRSIGDRRRPGDRWRIPRGSLILGIVVALEEWSQTLLPSRTASWGDLAADLAGILIIGSLACLRTVRPRSRARPINTTGSRRARLT